MCISNIINIIGLLFDIIGVLVLFKFGLPPDVSRGGLSYYVSLETDRDEERKANKYINISRLALGFIVLGFFFQLISNLPFFD